MENMLIAIFAIMFAAVKSGNVSSFMPDVGKGIAAGMSIFALVIKLLKLIFFKLDSKDEI